MRNIADIPPKWKDIRIAGITPNRDDICSICSICSTADILELCEMLIFSALLYR